MGINAIKIFFGFLAYANVKSVAANAEGLLMDSLSFDRLKVTNLSSSCASECERLKIALQHNEIWALKVNDASGRKSIEFFWGNSYFFGSEFACKMLNNPPEIHLLPSENNPLNRETLSIKPDFPVEYRVIYYTHRSPLQFNAEMFNRSILHVGLCLPQSCTELDLSILSNVLKEISFSDATVYGDVKFVASKRLKLRSNPLDNPFVSTFV